MSWERRIKPWSLAGCRRGVRGSETTMGNFGQPYSGQIPALAHSCCLAVTSNQGTEVGISHPQSC